MVELARDHYMGFVRIALVGALVRVLVTLEHLLVGKILLFVGTKSGYQNNFDP